MGNDETADRSAAGGGIDYELLLSVVETMIPARTGADAMPAASELREFRQMRADEAKRVYGPLLERIRSGRGEEEGGHFASLDREARESILRGIEVEQPGLLKGVVLQTLIRYYGTDTAARGLGLEVRPPHPHGYGVDDTDWSLLEPVREMKPIYKVFPGEGEQS